MNSRQSARHGLHVSIGGPQGVGKSTVLHVLASRRPDYEAISVGGQFPTDFRVLSDAERARVRYEASEHLSMQLQGICDRVLLVDLHYLDLRESTPRIQRPEILGLFDLHVLLTLPANLLIARRAADSSRRDRSISIIDAERDVAAHLKYFSDEIALGRSLILDCRDEPEHVADKLQRRIDAAVTRSSCPR